VGADAVSIPLTGPTPPAPLLAVTLEVDVAGQQLLQTFGPAPNQQYQYTWNGFDGYGRRLQGRQPITVRLGYVYPLVYLAPSAATALFTAGQSFGMYSWFGVPVSTSSNGTAERVNEFETVAEQV